MIDPIVQAALVASLPATITVVLQWQSRQRQKETHKVAEATRDQLTVNHHESDPPTMLDRMDFLTIEMLKMREWREVHDQLHQKESRIKDQ